MTGQVVALHPGKTIAEAAEAFLQRDMAATTRRSSTQTIDRFAAEHGTLLLAALDGATLDAFTAAAWGQCAAATWNRHVATLRSFTAFVRRRGWLTTDPASVLERRTFQSGSARLLPRLIGRRDAGPIFLAERRSSPAPAPASLDLCPITGRSRLSYERSAYLFRRSSLKVSKTGWTLHQLRHSALTHLAEAGVNLPLLLAKSGHESLRSLPKDARPSGEAVAAVTAAYDPARGRR